MFAEKFEKGNCIKRISVFVVAILVVAGMTFTGCQNKKVDEVADEEQIQFMEPIVVEKNPIATFKIKGYGTIKMELYPDKAPNTVCNFIKLIQDGAYDNSGIWRNHKDFVIQGGAPNNDSLAPSGFGIPGEFTANGYQYNDISHTEGVISMARVGTDMNSSSQQFFVCLSDKCVQLNGKYIAFGKLVDKKSMKVIKKIEANAESNMSSNGALYETIDFEGATVETFGEAYPDPIRFEK